MFIGVYPAKIRDDKILLPEVFIPYLINKNFCLYCVRSQRENHYYLLLESDDPIKKMTEEEKGVIHFGAARLFKKGRLFIPQKARELVELAPKGDVIIIGMFNAIELWSKKNWDIEKKYLRL